MTKFECNELSISDHEFGCEITFCEKPDIGELSMELTFDEMQDYMGRYIMIQRTYSEGENEDDYYFEYSDFGKSSELEDFKIKLSRTRFALYINDEIFEIKIKFEKIEFENLKLVLKKIINGKGDLIIEG